MSEDCADSPLAEGVEPRVEDLELDDCVVPAAGADASTVGAASPDASPYERTHPPDELSPGDIKDPEAPTTAAGQSGSPQSTGSQLVSPGSHTAGNTPASTCKRQYSLTAAPSHATPERNLEVDRFIPTARAAPWNSNMDDVDTSPIERLPRIDTQPKTKYDYLSEGTSLAHAGKPGTSTAKSGEPYTLSRGTAGTTSRSRNAGSPGRDNSYPRGGSPSRVRAPEPRPVPETPAALMEHLRARDAQVYVDEDAAYKNRLVHTLLSIDFRAAAREWSVGGVYDEASELNKCREFMRMASGEEDGQLTAEDIHGLLQVCTPTGVTMREAVDFLWEECAKRSSLTLRDFVEFGVRIRERLCDYDNFVQLADDDRLRATHARLFPNDPVPRKKDLDAARRRLLRVAESDANGEACQDKGCKTHLRVYEVLFLADYHVTLLDMGRVKFEDVEPVLRAAKAAAGGDFMYDLRQRRVEALERAEQGDMGTQTEEMAAGERREGAAASGHGEDHDGNDAHGQPQQRQLSAKAGRGQTSHRTTAQRSRSRRRHHIKNRGFTAGGNGMGGTTGTDYGGFVGTTIPRHQPWLATSEWRRRRPSFNLELRPKESDTKYLGRSIDDDYVERLRQDTNFVHLLQENYK